MVGISARTLVINNKVWLCFHYWGNKKCKTWADNKYGEEDFDSHINHWKGSLASYENRPFAFGGIVSVKKMLLYQKTSSRDPSKILHKIMHFGNY